MRTTIIAACLIALAGSALAEDDAYTVSASDGSKRTIMPSSARSYRNASGGDQWDALIEIRKADGSFDTRARVAVTGCPRNSTVRLMGTVQSGGDVVPAPISVEWSPDGQSVADMLAMKICIAARGNR